MKDPPSSLEKFILVFPTLMDTDLSRNNDFGKNSGKHRIFIPSISINKCNPFHLLQMGW